MIRVRAPGWRGGGSLPANSYPYQPNCELQIPYEMRIFQVWYGYFGVVPNVSPGHDTNTSTSTTSTLIGMLSVARVAESHVARRKVENKKAVFRWCLLLAWNLSLSVPITQLQRNSNYEYST
eukprot:scaffold206261_cov14-Prasinocladus_malaysianus.AAC.1